MFSKMYRHHPMHKRKYPPPTKKIPSAHVCLHPSTVHSPRVRYLPYLWSEQQRQQGDVPRQRAERQDGGVAGLEEGQNGEGDYHQQDGLLVNVP